MVRASRKAQKIRQDDAAGSIGVSENFLGKIERGSESVQWGKLFQVLEGLGVRVTGVCSAANVELVRSLRADHVIDYQKESIFDRPKQYQMVFDVVGHHSLRRCRKLLQPNGQFLMINPGPRNALDIASFRQRFHAIFMRPSQPDLNAITKLIEAGKVKPVIDREFALEDIAQAYKYAERGKGAGKVVVWVGL